MLDEELLQQFGPYQVNFVSLYVMRKIADGRRGLHHELVEGCNITARVPDRAVRAAGEFSGSNHVSAARRPLRAAPRARLRSATSAVRESTCLSRQPRRDRGDLSFETAASPAREARLLHQERGCVGAVRTSEPVRVRSNDLAGFDHRFLAGAP
ncbi:hypothetical protein [Nannocystis pusilla]|uniref:hypothetical protein n=1 Tax=Nannocystis pusilla TaxID=889268 RepID=UPI003DA44896